jgi:hypothetical protein
MLDQGSRTFDNEVLAMYVQADSNAPILSPSVVAQCYA